MTIRIILGITAKITEFYKLSDFCFCDTFVLNRLSQAGFNIVLCIADKAQMEGIG